eukprot:c11272_g1_i3.p1 GENE.c11272_g1_i3~~c11272_g1_i3.p1  ORF type:complete len:161 (+),score=17.78 c11272_g1_i3:67-549(+)
MFNLSDLQDQIDEVSRTHQQRGVGAKAKRPARMKTKSKASAAVPLNADDFQPPFHGVVGKWVAREDFKGKKSFGIFQCVPCSRVWKSAHGFKDFSQACSKCEEMVLPELLWQNEDRGYNPSASEASSVEATDKPHQRERCEVCLTLPFGRTCTDRSRDWE